MHRAPRLPPFAAVLLAMLCHTGKTTASETVVTTAEESMLETIVVTDTPLVDESFERPYAIDVVDADEFRGSIVGVNASELLSRVPGVIARNRHNYAQDLQISVRGFGSRTAFGVRGVRLIGDGIPASNPDGQGQAALFNLDTVERAEVIRGPFAALEGNHAGGVIRFHSRTGSGPPRLEAQALAGAWGTRRFGLRAEGERGGVGYLFDSSRFETSGFQRHSAARRDTGFAKLDLNPADDLRLTLVANSLTQPYTDDPQGLSYNTWRDQPRTTEAPARDFNTRKRIRHLQGGVRMVHTVGDNELTLNLHGGTRRVVQFQSIPVAPQANPRHAGGVIDLDRRFEGLGLRWSRDMDLGTAFANVSAGVDFERSKDVRRGFENFIGDRIGVRGALRRDESNSVSSLAPYVLASWADGPWTWSGGVRYNQVRFEVRDRYIAAGNPDDSGRLAFSRITSAVGLAYALSPSIQVFASMGTGFETPTLNELSYATPESGFNFALGPSRSRQWEVGLKHRNGANTRFDLVLFSIDTRNEIVVSASAGGRTSHTNAARTRRDGLEFGFATELGAGLSASGAVTLIDARYTRGFQSGDNHIDRGNRMPGIAKLTAYGEIAWRPAEGVRVGLEAEHRGRLWVEDRNRARPAPAHTLLHLSANAEQKVGPWTFGQTFRIDNLADRRHVASVIVGAAGERFYEPGPPRSWFAGLRLSHTF